jgi:hypothetical protein
MVGRGLGCRVVDKQDISDSWPAGVECDCAAGLLNFWCSRGIVQVSEERECASEMLRAESQKMGGISSM